MKTIEQFATAAPSIFTHINQLLSNWICHFGGEGPQAPNKHKEVRPSVCCPHSLLPLKDLVLSRGMKVC